MSNSRPQLVSIHRKKGKTLYLQLAEQILQFLRKNRLSPGSRLPTEVELERQYGVSRAVVRQALALLEDQRIIRRKAGKGTFVAFRPFTRSVPELTSFTEDMIGRRNQPSSRLISYRRARGVEISKYFGIDNDVVAIVRLRLANDKPIGIQCLYMLKEIAEFIGFTRSALVHNKNLSLYRSLEEAGFMIRLANEKISAKAADRFEARHLGVKYGEPLLRVHRETMSVTNELLEVVNAVYRADKYEYVLQLYREQTNQTRLD